MRTRSLPLRPILNEAVALGVGTAIEVSDFRNAVLALDIAGTATMTVKIQGSIADTTPDFSAAKSKANQWDYVQVIDLEDGSPIDGDTGVSVVAVADNKQLAINVNGLSYVNVEVAAYTAGTVSARLKTFTND